MTTLRSHGYNPPFVDCPTKGKKGADEDVVVHSQGKSYIQKKGLVKMTRSTCGASGHNKRYHDRPDVPIANDWFEGELEPVDEYANIVGNEQENMVSKRIPRRKGLPSRFPHLDQLQFMPTPMADRELQTGSLTSGPAATLLGVSVHTTEVNFDVIVDESQSIDADESSRLKAERPLKRRNVKATS